MFNLFLLQLLETEKHRKIFSWVYILEYEEFFWTYYLLYSLIWKDDTIGQMETCLLLICQASDCGAVSLFSGRQTTLATEQMCPGRSGPEDWQKVWPSAPAATRTLEHSLSAVRKMNPWPHIQWWASHILLVGVPGVPVEVTFLHSLYLVPF